MSKEILKKQTTVALLVKVEKTKNAEEKAAIVEILKSRGQDVSKWETAAPVEETAAPVEETVETKVEETAATVVETAVEDSETKNETAAPEAGEVDALRKEVDALIEVVIEEKRIGVYQEMIKALGGKFDSDFDELLAAANVEQLKEALSFRTLANKDKKDETKPKGTGKQKGGSKPKEEKAKPETTETCDLAEGDSVTVVEEGIVAKVLKVNVNPKGVIFCTLKTEDGKTINRKPNKLKKNE